MEKRLLLPFTHGVDIRAIEYAIRLAKNLDATLVPLALIHVPEGRRAKGARLEYIQQSKDFLEAVKHKAARYNVAVERFEVFTPDVVQSINVVAIQKECGGMLLFVGGKHGVLLQAAEIKRLMETAACKLYVMRLQSNDSKSFARALRQRLSTWLAGRQRQQDEPLEMQVRSEEEAAASLL